MLACVRKQEPAWQQNEIDRQTGRLNSQRLSTDR